MAGSEFKKYHEDEEKIKNENIDQSPHNRNSGEKQNVQSNEKSSTEGIQ